MKNVFAVISMICCSVAVGQAQNQKVDERQANQQVRIAEGVASGELSKHEVRALRAEQREIKRAEKRAKADGDFTAREKAMIARKQRKASAHIRSEKND